jgi:phage-related protein
MKELHWIGSSKDDLCDFPDDVKQEAGYALHLAQCGFKALNAVPMVGFGGAKVLEVVINDDGETYRAVYTVKFQHAIYVLHAFQKKSKRGSETPKPEMNLIHTRLKTAQYHHERTYQITTEEKKNEKGA